MAMELRDYQRDALERVATAREKGTNRLLVKMPTGCGKTVMFAGLLRWPALRTWLDGLPRRGASMLVIAHREELLDQAADKIQRSNPGVMVSIEQGDRRAHPYSDVVIASIQTLSAMKFRRLHRLMQRHIFRIVVVDECFPADTLVGTRAIQTVRPGDVVTAFDTERGQIVRRRVVRTIRRRCSQLIRVVAQDRRVICTPNHKVWTGRGWCPAGDLRAGDMMACITEPRHDQDSDRSDNEVRSVRGAHDPRHKDASGRVQAERADILRPQVSGRDRVSGVVSPHGEHQSAVRLGTDEGAQSHALGGGTRTSADDAQVDALETAGPGRQRSPAAAAASRVGGGVGMADGSRGSDQGGPSERDVPERLQVGYCEPRAEDRDRGGRTIASCADATSAGRKEGPVLGWSRVDRVEVLEPGRDGQFGGVCPGGVVYNLEVEGVHTYTANGLVVSNCHHAAASTYRTALVHLGFLPPDEASDAENLEAADYDDVKVMEAALRGWDERAPQDRLLMGVTATPNRTDAIGLGCVFQSIAYSYGLREAITDKWLVPIVPWVVETQTTLDAVRLSHGDFNQKDLAEAVNNAQRNDLAVAAWRDYAQGRPTLAFTVDVAHAHALADAFTQAGVRARAISGETPKDERRQTLADFLRGRVDIITNCMVLTEGTDLPLTGCILHCKPTKSATLYEQMTGRGLRIHPGKTDCIVIDLVDVARKHSLQAAPVLYGLPPGVAAQGKDLQQTAEDLEALRERFPNVDIEALLAQGRLTLDQLQAKASTFDIWTVPALGPVGEGLSLNWIRIGEDRYRLQYPWSDGTEVLQVERDVLGHYDVSCTLRPASQGRFPAPARQRTIGAQITSAREALAFAEAFVSSERGTVARLKDRDAGWRGQPASEKQLAMLVKRRVPHNPKTLTKGQASDLIDLAMSRGGR